MTLDIDVSVDIFPLRLRAQMQARRGITAVVGPNGAGKTTLLRAIAGLTPITGSVRLDDVEISAVPPEERPVGMLWQDFLLFPHLDVRDNVAFALRALGASRSEARVRSDAFLEGWGLGPLAGRSPEQISRGEAQRVALARLLIAEPNVLLLDEPFAALDIEAKAETRHRLTQDLERFAGVVILVTHDPREVLWLAEHVVVVEAGRVIQAGSPHDLASRPRSSYVAKMAGLNFYRGRAAAGRVDTPAGSISAATAPEGDVGVAIDPRSVALYRDVPHGSPRNVWRGRVSLVERQGDRCRVTLQGEIEIVAEITVGSMERLGVAEGAEMWASVKATEVEVYPF